MNIARYVTPALLINMLIRLNKFKISCVDSTVKRRLSPIEYALEFCTVAVDIGRRSGKTQYIKDHADAHSLVIVMNHYHKQEMERHFGHASSRPLVVTGAQLDQPSPPGCPAVLYTSFSKIYIDEPSLVYKYGELTKNQLYSRCVDPRGGNHQTFILLGA